MSKPSLNDVRKAFLDYFAGQEHSVLPSSALVPHNDPTLMFTNAGMNQFKNIFTGVEKSDLKRAATSQKCVRAGGKHNDLDNVGYTARHHTFFEMLGNFSFGDYFKEEAIVYGWEFLTKTLGMPAEKLLVTVYHDDDVAWNQWKKVTGFADHKIIRINTNDNFWSMGDTGPCGPCSEIFYDHGEAIAGGPPGSADQDGDRFTEIWNLVFMQYEQVDAATRKDLPKPSIDTGMGLERLTAVLQGVHDNYDIDLFKHLITDIAEQSKQLGADKSEAVAYRVIADHLRSCSFLIADGVMPSNEGRGYVLRRIMRRAMRYAHQLGCREPLMHLLVPSLVREMGGQYEELKRAQASIVETLRGEEERFKQTLDRGLKLLEEESASLQKGGKLSGEAAFKLYDTYGFPLDLTQDILRARGMGVDEAGFEKCMEGQREMARASHKGSGDTATSKIWFDVKEKTGTTEFTGYDETAGKATVKAIVMDGIEVESAPAGVEAFVVLDSTPFYAESGGQIGDTGSFTQNGKKLADVQDTIKPVEDLHAHKAKLETALQVGDVIETSVDVTRRDAIRANHSATHLLHKALRDKLGEHVTQKGSLVAADRLRFDFSHPSSVAREEIAEIETTVNAVVHRNSLVVCKVMAPEEAIKAGAMALFGEKYGDSVRVLSIGTNEDGSNYSTELCGGTHVRATGDIGLFKVTSEGSVASGIRRIEAVTGEAVRQYFIEQLTRQFEQLQKLAAERDALAPDAKKAVPTFSADTLKNARLEETNALYEAEVSRIGAETAALQEENKRLSKELAAAKKQQALASAGEVTKEMIGNVGFIGKVYDELDAKELRGVAEDLLKQAAPGIACVGSNAGGKASLVVAVSKDLSASLSAVELVQAAVAAVGGKGGGGKPEMAQGGGPDADKLDEALSSIRSLVSQKAA